jgi:methyl coenzyme M reductase subunit D
MEEYKPITKSDVNFPEYCIYFIRKILDDIDKKEMVIGDITNVSVETLFEIHPYCYDGVELVCRTLLRKGYEVMIPTFRKEQNTSGDIIVKYNWKVKKVRNIDDLPF